METPGLALGGWDFPYPGRTSGLLFWTMGRLLPLPPALAAVPGPVPTSSAAPAACSQPPSSHPLACIPHSCQLRAAGHGWILGCGGPWFWLLLVVIELGHKPLSEKQKS